MSVLCLFSHAPTTEYPLCSVQGATFDRLVMSLSKKVFQTAQAYTALSRLTTKAGLYLLDLDIACLKADMKAVVEMERLRFVSGIPLQGLPLASTALSESSTRTSTLPSAPITTTPVTASTSRPGIRPKNLQGYAALHV